MSGTIVVKHSHVTLSNTTATSALFDDGDEVNYSVTFIVQNIHGTATVYIGGAGVTTSSYGIKIAPNEKIDFTEMPRYPGIFAISDTDASKISVMRISK